VSFDEFLAMKKADFLYKTKYDPSVIYEFGLHMLDPEDPDDFESLPENVVESEMFKEDGLEEYHSAM